MIIVHLWIQHSNMSAKNHHKSLGGAIYFLWQEWNYLYGVFTDKLMHKQIFINLIVYFQIIHNAQILFCTLSTQYQWTN